MQAVAFETQATQSTDPAIVASDAVVRRSSSMTARIDAAASGREPDVRPPSQAMTRGDRPLSIRAGHETVQYEELAAAMSSELFDAHACTREQHHDARALLGSAAHLLLSGARQARRGFTNLGTNLYRDVANAPVNLWHALPSPGGVKDGLMAAPGEFWKLCDLRTMLQPGADDPAFLALMGRTAPEGRLYGLDRAFTFQRMEMELKVLLGVLKRGEDAGIFASSACRSARRQIAKLRTDMKVMQHGIDPAWRALMFVLNLVNLWPAIVPSPFLADQAKTFAYTVAAAAKATVGVAGDTLRRTSNGWPFPLTGGDMGHHANEVHFYMALLSGVYGPVYACMRYARGVIAHRAKQLEHSAFFHFGIALVCGMALLMPFLVPHLPAPGARRTGWRVSPKPVLTPTSAPTLSATVEEEAEGEPPIPLENQLHDELQVIFRNLEAGRRQLKQTRVDFIDSGQELTRTVSGQVTRMLEGIGSLSQRLDKAFSLSGPRGQQVVQGEANKDLYPKFALAAFSLLVAGVTIGLIQPDKIGTVDLAADGFAMVGAMLEAAYNKDMTLQDAMERFKGMGATSMVMCLVLGADRIAKRFPACPQGLIESSANSRYYAAGVMTTLAMTLPGPIARGAEMGLFRGGLKIVSLFTDPDGQVTATVAPATFEAAQARMRELHTYLEALSPGQLERYEEVAARSVMVSAREAQARISAEVAAAEAAPVDDMAIVRRAG